MPKSIHSGWVKARYIIESLRLKFWEKWWKNDSSQIDPGSFQQAYQSSRTSKHMLKHQMKWSWSFRKKFKILMKTYHSDDFLDPKFAFSPCWRMCCLRRASREIQKWLVEHISCALKEKYGVRQGLVLGFASMHQGSFFGNFWQVLELVCKNSVALSIH